MISNYSYQPEPVFHAARNERTNDSTRYFGIENEISYRSGVTQKISSESLSDMLDEIGGGFTYCKRDVSIDNVRGVELVTHPGTLAYHAKECHWKHLNRTAQKNGFRSHDATPVCGLHVHVNRVSLGSDEAEQAETIRKMTVMLARHESSVVRFTRRSSAALSQWAPIPSIPSDYNDIRVYSPHHNDRYTALNVTNEYTVEFRIFRGTLRRDTIIAALQFVNNWCDYAMSHSWEEVESSDFLDIMKTHEYNELNQYLIQRGLLAPDVPAISANARLCDFQERAS